MEEDLELDDGDPLCNSFNSFCKYLCIVPPPMAINCGREGGWMVVWFVCLLTRGQLTDQSKSLHQNHNIPSDREASVLL